MFLTGRNWWDPSPLEKQESLIFAGFVRLMRQLSLSTYRGTETTAIGIDEDVSIDQKKELLTRLHSFLLPLLERQITNLLDLLDPFDLQEETASKFQLILDIQSALEDTMGELQSLLYTFCPELVRRPRSHYMNDQHLKELKKLQLKGLDQYFRRNDLHFHLSAVFAQSNLIIQELRLSSIPSCSSPSLPSIPRARKFLIDHTSSSRKMIQSMIDWLAASELQHIQDLWLNEVSSIDRALVDCLVLINSSDTEEHNNQTSESVIEPSAVNPRIKPVIQVAKSLIPVIKLSRMFLKKLSERAMNASRLPSFTEMDSDQLDRLSGTATQVRLSLDHILRTLKSTERRNHDGFTVMSYATAIQRDLQDALLHVVLHFVPRIPETQGFHGQNHYRTWFIVWLTQFKLAIQNLIDVTEVLPGPENNG
ncbi:hypothetical protein PCASD_26376 [Puccinia coronata f. sp. avenae]|uniref:Uncharacterized protein n=2 Tax=Puccinia coronata f. sp. avenae TaxID=200324 RepID=A0A2N5RTY0_9BASI|nr:hypothetical protein PCASD_26376 [Puccinia coronata f. sp. avenae]